MFRDAEDRKISPEIDDRIGQSRAKLQQANNHHASRALILAVAALTSARKLATDAFASASAQVAQINAIEPLPPIQYRRGGGTNRLPGLVELPMRMRMSGSRASRNPLTGSVSK